jgi:hypothetical protein
MQQWCHIRVRIFGGHFEMFSDGFGKATLGFDNSTCVGFAIYMNLGV